MADVKDESHHIEASSISQYVTRAVSKEQRHFAPVFALERLRIKEEQGPVGARHFFAISPSPGNVDLFKKLNAERAKITARVCYCSVFDECWVSSGRAIRPDRVPSCPAPVTPFQAGL